MQTQDFIEKKRKELKPYLAEKFFVNKIGCFGSYSQNEQNEESDIDVLVEFSRPIGGEFFDLKDLLEKGLQNIFGGYLNLNIENY